MKSKILFTAFLCITSVFIYSCASRQAVTSYMAVAVVPQAQPVDYVMVPVYAEPETESYSEIVENTFLDAFKSPTSTFGLDVDTAAYANTRRFINDGSLPPKDAVRIEELINYFGYNYPAPEGMTPVAAVTEYTSCPWNEANKLLLIGVKAKNIETEKIPDNNLVFLLDVSGSMEDPDKLPLLKSAFKMFVKQLRPNDRVAIVVYAGASGLALPSTPGNKKKEILEAIDKLQAGGSTAGGEGLALAYKVAWDNIKKGGNNRIILATDGDFNVGPSSDDDMVRLIEQNRDGGIYLSVLGFGTGNLKDSKMEKIADNGNGNYSYIDSILEAKKVLVNEFGGTVMTVAKDVKIQLEFNPSRVKSYRLIGYENRVMKREDFTNDKKDSGDMGAGHSVTALYEIVPGSITVTSADDTKYVETKIKGSPSDSEELLLVKLRYKQPNGKGSKEIRTVVMDKPVEFQKASENLRFASSVAAFGMLLRNSAYKGKATFKSAEALAKGAKGEDTEGYRAEFIRLIQLAEILPGYKQSIKE